MNVLFSCSLLINYSEDSSKFLFELVVVALYEFLILFLLLRCLVKKLMQLEINSIKDCILEKECHKQFLVHLESEPVLVEFNI